MAPTSEYLEQLKTDKQNLGTKMSARGVTVSDDDTFTTLVAKFDEIQSGGGKYAPRHISFRRFGGNELTEEVQNLDTSNMTNMAEMFSDCRKLVSLDLGSFDTSQVTNMNSMFYYCNNLSSLDLGSFDTSQVTNMGAMFSECNSLKSLDLRSFDTSQVTKMGSMFRNCYYLTELDLSSFDSSKLTEASGCTFSCHRLKKVIINNSKLFKIPSSDFFSNNPITNGSGFVYVPDEMVETYKSATNWSVYASQIKGISELPKEG